MAQIDFRHPNYPSPPPGEEAHPSALALLSRILEPAQTGGATDKARLLARFRFHTVAVWRRLFDHCSWLGPYRPNEQQPMAELALQLAERLPAGIYGFRAVKDCQALSATVLAECHLRLLRLDEAEASLRQAEKAAAAGAGAPTALAPVLMVRALLDRSRGKPGAAEALLARAAELFGSIPADELQGVALIRRGVLLEQMGRATEAAEALGQGLQLSRGPHYAALQRRGAAALVRLIQSRV